MRSDELEVGCARVMGLKPKGCLRLDCEAILTRGGGEDSGVVLSRGGWEERGGGIMEGGGMESS